MMLFNSSRSMFNVLDNYLEFFREESCGQCTPCREGNLHIKLFLEKMSKGEATELDIKTMKKIASIMPMSSLCGLGESAQNALLSAWRVFPETFEVGGAE